MGGAKAIRPPLTEETVAGLRVGDRVEFSGALYTARDAAHRRLVALAEAGEALPIDLRGQVLYYVGPTPPRAGEAVGAAGPTTAMRLDPYTPRLLELGLKGMIGKGGRGQAVREAMRRRGAVYCIAVGGAGALLSGRVTGAELVAFGDLGTEAIRRLEVERFPAIVANDAYGGDLLEAGKARYRTSARRDARGRNAG